MSLDALHHFNKVFYIFYNEVDDGPDLADEVITHSLLCLEIHIVKEEYQSAFEGVAELSQFEVLNQLAYREESLSPSL